MDQIPRSRLDPSIFRPLDLSTSPMKRKPTRPPLNEKRLAGLVEIAELVSLELEERNIGDPRMRPDYEQLASAYQWLCDYIEYERRKRRG